MGRYVWRAGLHGRGRGWDGVERGLGEEKVECLAESRQGGGLGGMRGGMGGGAPGAYA